MGMRTQQSSSGGRFGTLFTVLLFLMMLAVLAAGVANLAGSTSEEGVESTRLALERATVLCYAIEGFYPPNLEYIRMHYGVAADEARYAVRYETQGANLMPSIRVVARGN